MSVDWLIFAEVYLLWLQRKGKRQKYHIQMLGHLLLFSGVSYCDNRERVVMFDYDTKEKKHQNTRQSDLYSEAKPPRTNRIASCFGVLSFTYMISRFLRHLMYWFVIKSNCYILLYKIKNLHRTKNELFSCSKRIPVHIPFYS
jgi:hypothetical protein